MTRPTSAQPPGSSNPFARPGPRHDLMVDRPGLLQDLVARICGGQSVVLVGPEGAGKSTLLRGLHKLTLAREVLPPHMLLLSLPLPPDARTGALVVSLQHRLKKCLERNGLDWGDVPWIQDVRAVEATDDALAALSVLFAALEDEGLTVVLELEPLAGAGAASSPGPMRLLAWLEPWLQREVRLLGSVRAQTDVPPQVRGRMVDLDIGPFTMEEALLFLRRPIARAGYKVSEEDLERLLQVSGRMPGALHTEAARLFAGIPHSPPDARERATH